MKIYFCVKKYNPKFLFKRGYISIAVFIIFIALFSSCTQYTTTNKNSTLNNTNKLEKQFKNPNSDILNNTQDTIATTNTNFSINNGVFFYKKLPFSGILKKYYPRVKMTTYTSVYKGKRNGIYNSFYKNGQPYEIKEYQNNRAIGRHLMYWKNGNLKADYFYEDGKMQGTQKRWYDNGNQYTVFNYTNGTREGKQKAWRTSGVLYMNNDIKDGKTYGLNRASMCYRVKKEQPVIQGYLKVPTEKKE